MFARDARTYLEGLAVTLKRGRARVVVAVIDAGEDLICSSVFELNVTVSMHDKIVGRTVAASDDPRPEEALITLREIRRLQNEPRRSRRSSASYAAALDFALGRHNSLSQEGQIFVVVSYFRGDNLDVLKLPRLQQNTEAYRE